MSSTQTSGSCGVGFVGLLTITFIVLKLTGAIHWAWLWVLSPLWITAVASALVVFVAILVAAVSVAVRELSARPKR